MDGLLVVCAGIALACALIALGLLPGAARVAQAEPVAGDLVAVAETVD